MEFLRRCPSCGRRFSIRVERRVLVDKENDTTRIVHDIIIPRTSRGGGFIAAAAVAEEVPIERDTFEVSYECKRCGHEWSEKLVVVKKDSSNAKPSGEPWPDPMDT
jgi:DNA-directed RNA polymerase subunit RPC12/RpoP